MTTTSWLYKLGEQLAKVHRTQRKKVTTDPNFFSILHRRIDNRQPALTYGVKIKQEKEQTGNADH